MKFVEPVQTICDLLNKVYKFVFSLFSISIFPVDTRPYRPFMMLERLADFRPSPIRVDRVRDKDRNRLYRDCCKGLDDRCEFPYDIRKFPHDFKPDPNRHAIIIDTPKEGTPRVFEDDSECQRKISKRERCEDSECQRKIPKREHAWARPDISTEYKGKSLKGADVWAEIQRRTVLVSPTIGKLRCENERLQAEVDFLEIQKISLQKDVEEEKKRSRDVRISLNAVGKYADFLAKVRIFSNISYILPF